MRFLTPTENKRLNELIGFLCVVLAVLTGLALISYNPSDAAFNVSAPADGEHAARNWIGPAGAYLADAYLTRADLTDANLTRARNLDQAVGYKPVTADA